MSMSKTPRLSKEEIEAIVQAAGLDESLSMTDREIARLAPLFNPSTLETVAIQHFGISQAEIINQKIIRKDDAEGLNRDLLTNYRNKGRSRKDLYRVLLEAESEGILHDVDMTKVEKLILDLESEVISDGHPHHSGLAEVKKTRKFADVANLENGHRCRATPVEATIYYLEATGTVWAKFKSDFKASLIPGSKAGETSSSQKEKNERKCLEIAVDFTREQVAWPPPPTAPRYRVFYQPEPQPGPSSATPSAQPNGGNMSPKLTKEDIDKIVKAAGFDKLPDNMDDSEMSRLASLFTKGPLTKLALEYFAVTVVDLEHFKDEEDLHLRKTHILKRFYNKVGNRETFYRRLREAEADGILDDVDMKKVDNLILNPDMRKT